MDRYLFSGALALLIFQVLYLLADLGLLGSYNLNKQSYENQAPIGRLIQKKQAVKRKALNSLIWEEPEKNEQLYRYDSVLTLENSGAELELEGDIKLNVHENTLVVLEPMQKSNREDLRVRFQRGLLRARTQSQRMSIGSGDWVLEANEGANLSIRALDNEKLEVEVNEGQVQLQNKETDEVKSFSDGQKLTLDPKEILKEETLDESLSFTEPSVSRIYSHNFPMPVEVSWEGPAKELVLLNPNRAAEEISLESKSSELLFLNPGTYLLTLKNGDLVSPSFTLELKPAPQLKYLHPLPRDRVDTRTTSLFSWFQQQGVQNYKVNLESSAEESWSTDSESAYIEIKPPLMGRYEWSVEATDQDGYRIPPYYSIPVYFTDQPLAAPKLNAPKKRVPASKKKNKDGAWLEKIWNLLFPKAHADELRVKREVVFTWFEVPGADFYIIEISESEDFLSPLVIKKVKAEEFSWSGFGEKKYFWRVAAGQEGGRMGLFSEASEFDVPLLKTLKNEDLSAGVRYVETPKPTPVPTPVPTPTPTPPPPPPEPKKPLVAPETKYEFAIHVDYLNLNQENEDLESAKFTGLASFSVSGSKTWWISEKVWVSDFDLMLLSWKAKDESELPFQEEVTNIYANVKFYRVNKDWGLGAMLSPVSERADLEEIQADDVFSLGAFYQFNIPMDKGLSAKSQFGLYYGDSIFFGLWENELRYELSRTEKRIQYFGTNIDLGISSGGEDFNGTWTRFGISYGWDW